MGKNYSFYLIIFISSWLLIIVGLVLGYFYATSTIEVAKFEYLPKKVQSLYVKREDIDKMSRYFNIQKSEIIPTNQPISSDINELQSQVKSLREKNQALYQDNVNLTDKNWELVNNLKQQEKISDAKSSEYEKIKELSNKISNLQKSNIIKTKEYKINEQRFKDEIEKLNIKLRKKDLNLNSFSTTATKSDFQKNPNLAKKNSILNEEISQIRVKLQASYNQNTKLLDEKGKEIRRLKEQISQKDININNLLSKHTNELIDIEKKNAIELRNLKQQIASLQIHDKKNITQKDQEIKKLEKELEDALLKLKSNQITFEEQNKNSNNQNLDGEILLLRQKNQQLSRVNEALEIKLQDMEDKIRNITFQKEKDYDDILKKVKTSLEDSNEDVQRRTSRLERRILEAASIIDSLKKQNDSLENKLSKYDNKNIISIEKFDKIEEKHARNYKIFNEVVQALEEEKKQIAKKAKQNFIALEDSTNDKIKELYEKYLEANASVAGLNLKLDLVKFENKSLKMIGKTKNDELEKKYKQVSSELNSTNIKLKNANEKFLTLQKQNDKLASENSSLLKSLNFEKKELKNRNDNLLKEIHEQKDRLEKNEKYTQNLKKENIKLTNINNQMLKDNHEKSSKLQAQYNKSQKDLIFANNELVTLKDKLKNFQQNSKQANTNRDKLLIQKDEKIKLLTSRVTNVGETLKFTQDKLARMKDEKDELKKDIVILNEEIQAVKISKDENKNVYEQTIAQLKLEKSEIKQGLDDKIFAISGFEKELTSIKEENKILSSKLDEKLALKQKNIKISKELIAKYNETLNDLRNRKAEIMALKNSLKELKEKKIDKSYQEKISKLEKNIKTLEEENLLLKSSSKKVTSKSISKPKLITSIKCDDMKIGSNRATFECKRRVKEFLTKYNPSYFFEVTPIVDSGGFASLKKVANSKIGIPITEIQRLTRLSNIGLGKDRSRSGGEIIREVFGDLARISYANINENISKKRGFVIRVYE